MTRRKFNVNVVNSLAIFPEIVETQEGNQKKQIQLEEILMMNLCYRWLLILMETVQKIGGIWTLAVQTT